MINSIPTFQDRLAPIVSAMGCELVGCELLPAGRKRLLRLYVDKQGGVTVEDCSTISRQVSAMLDVEDPIQGEYILEVSSPGIDRPLFTWEHYLQYVGSQIKVKMRLPINKRRQYKGLLAKVENDAIYIVIDGEEQATELPFNLIEKGNLVGNINL